MHEGKNRFRILVSGGGTGGHIFPALAIADAIRRAAPGSEFLFVGADNRMEMERVPAAGYRIEGLPVAGFDRKRLWRNFKVIAKLLRSLIKARRIIRDFKPDIAIGVGGYASGPMLKEAQRKGIPTLIQEQNSYAGVTNKLLAKRAGAICVAYEGMDRFFPSATIHMTGNPVRSSLSSGLPSREDALEQLGFDGTRPLVVVTGGSLGARTINESMRNAVSLLENAGIAVLWQTGKLYYNEFCGCATENVRIVEFISDMNVAYAAASLVVARAGASTISELQLLGVPAVLIPSPMVAEDHQRKNAMALVNKDAAVMILDEDARSVLGETVRELIGNANKLSEMSNNIRGMAISGSDDKIAEIALRLIADRK